MYMPGVDLEVDKICAYDKKKDNPNLPIADQCLQLIQNKHD
jgi:hypothetical protein